MPPPPLPAGAPKKPALDRVNEISTCMLVIFPSAVWVAFFLSNFRGLQLPWVHRSTAHVVEMTALTNADFPPELKCSLFLWHLQRAKCSRLFFMLNFPLLFSEPRISFVAELLLCITFLRDLLSRISTKSSGIGYLACSALFWIDLSLLLFRSSSLLSATTVRLASKPEQILSRLVMGCMHNGCP